VRAAKTDLLRVVAVEVDGVRSVVPDRRGRLPGRGASVHPVSECVDLAERRRAFARALRSAGPLDVTPLRRFVAGDEVGASTGTPGGDMTVR
jgi:predicted RNA-binding protein YlxR (DUF448 family)